MRNTYAIVLLFIAGCSQVDTFDPNDFDATMSWLQACHGKVTDAEESGNQLKRQQVREEVREEVNATLQRFVGETIEWDLYVVSVSQFTDGTWVKFLRYELSSVSDIHYFLFPGAVPSEVLREPQAYMYNAAGNEVRECRGISVGPMITRERAAQLEPGDTVRITGNLAAFHFTDSPFFECKLFLSNVKVVE